MLFWCCGARPFFFSRAEKCCFGVVGQNLFFFSRAEKCCFGVVGQNFFFSRAEKCCFGVVGQNFFFLSGREILFWCCGAKPFFFLSGRKKLFWCCGAKLFFLSGRKKFLSALEHDISLSGREIIVLAFWDKTVFFLSGRKSFCRCLNEKFFPQACGKCYVGILDKNHFPRETGKFLLAFEQTISPSGRKILFWHFGQMSFPHRGRKISCWCRTNPLCALEQNLLFIVLCTEGHTFAV